MLCPANFIVKASHIYPICGRLTAVKPDMIHCIGRLCSLQRHGTRLVVFTVPSRSIFRMPGTDSNKLKPMFKKDGIGSGYTFSYGKRESSFLNYWIPAGYVVAGFSIVFLMYNIIRFDYFGEKSKQRAQIFEFTLSDEKLLTYAALCYIVTTVLITVIVFSNSLLRMYYNRSSNEFIAVIRKYGLYNTNIIVKPGEVEKLPKYKPRGNVKIKGKLVWWNEKNFTSSKYYNILMGYDISREQPAIDRQSMKSDDIRELKKMIDAKRSEQFVKNYEEKMKQKSCKKRS
ncbi:hypothetical protein ACF0H5_006137 [Mactra antiquata]